jgi:hypothetical protein
VSIRWMLLRSWLVNSSIAIFRLYVGEFWSGLLSCLNTFAARLRYSSKKAKAFKLGHYPHPQCPWNKRVILYSLFLSLASLLTDFYYRLFAYEPIFAAHSNHAADSNHCCQTETA